MTSIYLEDFMILKLSTYLAITNCEQDDNLPDVAEEAMNGVEKAPEGTPETGGLLVVTVHEGEDLEGKHHTNPFVRVIFKGDKKETPV